MVRIGGMFLLRVRVRMTALVVLGREVVRRLIGLEWTVCVKFFLQTSVRV